MEQKLPIYSIIWVWKCCYNKLSQMGGKTLETCFSHGCRDEKCKIKVSAGLISSESFLLGLKDCHLSTMSLHNLSAIKYHPGEFLQVPLIRTPVKFDKDPTHMTLCNLNRFFKGPAPYTCHILRSTDFRFQHFHFRGAQLSP